MNNDTVKRDKVKEGNLNEAFQFGGATSAFTRFKKPCQVQEQPQIDSITNTRSNRKTAFARIKQLFSLKT
jgi:hypothetical protein